ncbi:MAG: HD domain-containing protein [Desulfovibrio sp.]|jgi:hypothetical protein|nr:HD domain-containing protein [Desulfovibrio sp.]
MDIQRKRFLSYAEGYLSGSPEVDPYLKLKIDHSLRVYGNATDLLAREEELREDPLPRALLLAALYHDVGRFEQYMRYRTFSDAISCDHGALGAKIIKEQDFFADEDRDVGRLARAAVAAHNRPALPEVFERRYGLVLTALRDADKVDILRVIAEELAGESNPDAQVLMRLKNEEGAYSPLIVRALDEGRVAKYGDMRYVNDFRIVLCTWLWDLRFASSLRAVREGGYLVRIAAGLSVPVQIKDKIATLIRKKLDLE